MRVSRNADDVAEPQSPELSIRTPENVNERWTKIFKVEAGTLGIVGSLTAFVLLVIWLHDDAMGGGLGYRDPNGVTVQYFNWHPLLMALGFLVCMAPAMLGFENLPFARHSNKNVHAVLNTLALVACMAGFSIILDCHNTLGDSGSFKTVHGCLGLITLIVLALNYLGGLIMYVFKCGGALRGTLKPLHKRMGLFCIILGLATLCLGVQEKEDKNGLEFDSVAGMLAHAIAIITILSLGGIVFSVAKFVDKKDAEPQYKPINQANPVTYGGNDTAQS